MVLIVAAQIERCARDVRCVQRRRVGGSRDYDINS